jgi:hypothetical protein
MEGKQTILDGSTLLVTHRARHWPSSQQAYNEPEDFVFLISVYNSGGH